MARYFQNTKFFWITVVLLLGGGFMLLFPSGNAFSGVQIKQQRSNERLSAYSKWMLAKTDKENALSCLETLSVSERGFLLNAVSHPPPFFSEKFDLLGAKIRLDMFSDYIVYTNTTAVAVFPNGRESCVVAFERYNLWPDETRAVYLKSMGVIRMKNDDFLKMLKKKSLLKYNARTHLWVVDKTTTVRSGTGVGTNGQSKEGKMRP